MKIIYECDVRKRKNVKGRKKKKNKEIQWKPIQNKDESELV